MKKIDQRLICFLKESCLIYVLYTVQCTLYSIQYIVIFVYCILYIVIKKSLREDNSFCITVQKDKFENIFWYFFMHCSRLEKTMYGWRRHFQTSLIRANYSRSLTKASSRNYSRKIITFYFWSILKWNWILNRSVLRDFDPYFCFKYLPSWIG